MCSSDLLKGSLDTRLAYIVTGDKEVDDLSKAGLEGLSEVLRNRTSVEPGDPVGLDLERDEPRFYPLIYWPITASQPNLSPRASAALDRYLRTGGILFIDTRDQQMSFDKPANGNPDLKTVADDLKMEKELGFLKSDIDVAKYADLSIVDEASKRLGKMKEE